MAALALLVSRLAGLTSLTTRLSARLVAEPMRYLAGKAFERKLLVYNLPYRRLALANDPEIVETVLIDRHSCFPKSAVVTTLLRPMIGAGVFGQQGGDAVRLARRLFIQALGRVGDDEVSRIARLPHRSLHCALAAGWGRGHHSARVVAARRRYCQRGHVGAPLQPRGIRSLR